MKFKFLLVIVFMLSASALLPRKANSQVVLNEVSCSNLVQFIDNHSDYNDWFELYNGGLSSVNLGGYYLSDDSLNNMKWQIPASINIGANGFLRFWASGRDEVVGTDYHTSFKLTQTKNTKEFVVLSNPSGVIIDYIKLSVETKKGHSYGRTLNGISSWSVFTAPTPNASNNTAIPYDRYADKPDVSLGAGFYFASVGVAITTTELNADIHYTLDGTEPTVSSPIYSTPLSIPSTKVLKAITISTDPAVLTSFMRFETYFINVSHTLPVVSISATSLTTLANGSGTLEPTGSFEYFDTTLQRTAKSYGEFNRHGQDSWVLSQRSLDFVSRDEMGYNHSIEQQLFNITPRTNFQRIILRAAGDDNYPADHNNANAGSAHLRDAYIHMLSLKGGLNLDVRTAAKCVVYINGLYWGVYDIRENPDEHDFTDYYYGQDKFHLQYIETWGNTWAEYGGAQALTDYNNLYNYIINPANSMTDSVKYKFVTDQYDAKSLADYVIVNAFTVCSDWLNYNTGWWRGLDSTGTHLKWGYILWDNDATFGHYINYTGIPNTNFDADPCDPQTLTGNSDPKGHIKVLNKLRQNPEFEQYYVGRMIDLWNTVFSCDNMIDELDSVTAVIDPEMAQHSTRWNGTYTEWQTNVTAMRDFIQQRCAYLAQGFINCYGLSGPHTMVVDADPAVGGSVKLNSLVINQFPWTGSYFGGMDTKFEALPNSNYSFIDWTSGSQNFNPNATSLKVAINLNNQDTITAHFLYTTSVIEMDDQLTPYVAAYPSAFSDATNLQYNLMQNAPVNIRLYSAIGTEIATLVDNSNAAQGSYSVKIDFTNTSLAAGIYYVDFISGNFRKSIKLIYQPN